MPKIIRVEADGSVVVIDNRTLEEAKAEALARVLAARDQDVAENIGTVNIALLVFNEHDPQGGYLTTQERTDLITYARTVRDKMAAAKAAWQAASTNDEADLVQYGG